MIEVRFIHDAADPSGGMVLPEGSVRWMSEAELARYPADSYRILRRSDRMMEAGRIGQGYRTKEA